MNRNLLLILGGFFCISSYSQKFTLSSSQQQPATVYVGIDNEISCTVEGLSCESVLLSTNNGTITKRSCNYIFRPVKTGGAKIIINKKKNNRLQKVGEFIIVVKDFPGPVVTVGGTSEREINKGFFNAQTGVGCYYIVSGFNINCTITNFFLTVTREGSIIFHSTNKGNIFNDETKTFSKSLQKGDLIIISGVIYLSPDSVKKMLTLSSI